MGVFLWMSQGPQNEKWAIKDLKVVRLRNADSSTSVIPAIIPLLLLDDDRVSPAPLD